MSEGPSDERPPAGPSYQQPPQDTMLTTEPALVPERVKPTRPWYKRKRFVIPGAVAFLGVLGLAPAFGGGSSPSAAPAPSASVSTAAPATFSLYQSCSYVQTDVQGVLDFGYADESTSLDAENLNKRLRTQVAQSPVPIHSDLALLISNLDAFQAGTVTMTVADFTVPADRVLAACGVDYTSPNDPLADVTDEPTDEASDEATEEATEEPTEEPQEETKFDKLTDEQQDAYGSAQDYLASSGFSKAGLIDQLSSEYGDDYDKKDAKAAVDALDEDWYKQAVREAKSYRESGHFSTQGLIEQLESDYGAQFTHDQAVYGAKHSR